nr:PREDICTED: uncharacterized protein LOC109036477 [Bemisia tabaci]
MVRESPIELRETWHWDFFIPRSYYYYDTPDGQDLVKKLWFLTTTFGKAGVVHGALMCFDPLNPVKGPARHALRILEFTKPWMAIPCTFAITTHFLVKFREKDDILNYSIAGALSGTYMGFWYKCTGTGLNWGFLLFLVATAFKYNVSQGYSHLGGYVPINYRVQTMTSLKEMDYSVIPEYPRNWYKAEEVAEKKIELPKGKPVFDTWHTH